MKLFILIIALFYCGCDLFNTRFAEEPDIAITILPQAFEKENLIQNLIRSFKEKKLADYLEIFSDSLLTGRPFIFMPSSDAAQRFPFLQDRWGKSDEEQYFKNLIANVKDASISISFSDENYSPQADSVIYTAGYLINILFEETSLPQEYSGEVIFYMSRDVKNIWRIYFWQDIRSGILPSWSELKGRMY